MPASAANRATVQPCLISPWSARSATETRLSARPMGIHGQNLFVDRTNRLVIAKVSSQGTPIDNLATALTHRAVAEIRNCLTQT
jgi:hypothetical protein